MYTNIHVFDSPQQISIIKYDPKKYKTQIVQAPQMTMTSHLAKENQAEAAINGSYFNVKTGAPTTFIRLDGIVRGETTRAEAFRTDGAISTDKNKIKIHTFDSITSKKLGKKYKNILAAGPLLLKTEYAKWLRPSQKTQAKPPKETPTVPTFHKVSSNATLVLLSALPQTTKS